MKPRTASFTLRRRAPLSILVPAVLALSLSCATGVSAVRSGSMDVMYANAFVQGPAERLPPDRLDRKTRQLEKAKALYLKGDRTLSAELERRFPDLGAALAKNGAEPVLAAAVKADVPLLYWEAAAIMSAFSLNPLDINLSMRVKDARVLMARAYELDPDFGNGSLDEFYIPFYGSLPSYLGGDKELAKRHFDEAVRKSGGGSIGAYVSYAMSVCVPKQDYAEWKRLMEKALAVDVNKYPDRKLANAVARKKALWLYSRKDDLFLAAEGE